MPRPQTVVVWICDNCGNYYGSSSAGNLHVQWNHEKNSQKQTFQRSRCPNPACAGALRNPITLRVPSA